MKTNIHKYCPSIILKIWFCIREKIFLILNGDRIARFSKIYRSNLWKNPESASGYGSTWAGTEYTRIELAAAISRYAIDSILDAACGDFNWMRSLPFSGNYIGVDIVESLIAANQAKYGDSTHRFICSDIVLDPLPRADLILCRDCLNHFSLAEARMALTNISRFSSKLVIATHFPNNKRNLDQQTSFRYRPLNLTKNPFFLREPDQLINDAANPSGKYLALWDIRISPIITSAMASPAFAEFKNTH